MADNTHHDKKSGDAHAPSSASGNQEQGASDEHSRQAPEVQKDTSKVQVRGVDNLAKYGIGAIIALLLYFAVFQPLHSGSAPGVGGFSLANSWWLGSPGSVAASAASAGWQPIEIGPTPIPFNPNGVSVWDMDHPMGCIYVRLAKWAGGTNHGPYCDNGSDPDNETPQGVEMVWSASGSTFEAMVKLGP